MKTLQESLFDQDVKKINVQIGELYELSDISHHNGFSNNPIVFISMFKYIIKKWNCKFVDSDNNFIKYWEQYGVDGLAALIDIILQMPASVLNDLTGKDLKKELKPYVNTLYYKDLCVSVRRFKNGEMFEITIYNDISSSTPHSMKITLVKK